MSSHGEPFIPKEETKIPEYGLKLKLDHVYPEDRTQNYTPSLRIIFKMLPLILRYIWYYITHKISGKSIIMDYVHTQKAKRIYGVPIGGIGCGSIGRGYRGEFCRFQLRPGLYEYYTVDANQFIITIKNKKNETILQSLLSTFPRKSLKSWENNIDGSQCSYTGLYPRAWTEYDLTKYGIKLTCRQVSPIIPNNYKDSSLPCAAFIWHIDNISDEEKTVTLAFTFKNGTGNEKQDRNSTCSSKEFSYLGSEGVVLHHTINKMPCTYALSVKSKPEFFVSKCLYFDPNSDGSKVWNQLKSNGAFDKPSEKSQGHIFGEMGCGIAVKTTVASKFNTEVEMSLTWDMPTVSFPTNSSKKFNRYYTKYFGVENAVLKMVDYCFENYMKWEEDIYDWQRKILDDGDTPEWYKTALFNQTYYVSDGGTVWFALDENEASSLPPNDPRREYGRFAYLEGHEYKMYNTYDVHFYASFCLIMNWPWLQISLQYDMKDSIFQEIPSKWKMLYDGHVVERKMKNTVPHDVGDPGEAPFNLINSYNIHDVSEWRDLNVKFVNQVFRDIMVFDMTDSEKKQYLIDMYDALTTVMNKTLLFDIDNDGLIENSGKPDQTYDTWIMHGSSAYCGGLWLAALFSMTKIAEFLGKPDDVSKYQALLDRASYSYERKLWNGKYYNFDCSSNEYKSIMADQLCGIWYLRLCGLFTEVVPPERAQSALKTIFENNVVSVNNGTIGAINGFIDGKIDYFTIQSFEIWTGVTYAVAAHMLIEGMWNEGWQTAGGMYKSMTERMGLSFDVPEALYVEKYYRSIGYMRPLSIWSIQLALERLREKKKN